MDWRLPLTPSGQLQLFKRIYADFDRETGIVPPSKRAAYRKKDDQVNALRNMICFYTQIRELLGLHMAPPDFMKFENEILETDRTDHELHEVMAAQPLRFAVSMLSSQRKKMSKDLEMREMAACASVERERMEVRRARWQYFATALQKDWDELDKVRNAIRLVKLAARNKEILWRKQMINKGHTAVKLWMDSNMRLLHVPKVELTLRSVNDFKQFLVPSAESRFWDVRLVGKKRMLRSMML